MTRLEFIEKQESILENTKNVWRKKSLKVSKRTILYTFRYVYVTLFFFMLSGMFTPLIRGKNYESPFVGVIILYVGLLGAIFLYESTQQFEKQKKYMATGFILIALSTIGIYMIVGDTRVMGA